MGLILHPQRRGIESLAPYPEAIPPGFANIDDITNTQFFDSEGASIYPAGVSTGVGTCSDILGLHVLVFTAQRPESFYFTEGQRSIDLAYSVIVRSPSEAEREIDALAQSGIARRAVELLTPAGFDERGAIFKRTGHVALYTNLVT